MDVKEQVFEICEKAKLASRDLAAQSTEVKNNILADISAALEANCNAIIEANKDKKSEESKRSRWS